MFKFLPSIACFTFTNQDHGWGSVCFELAGIFVALALRFDMSRGREKTYFTSAFAGYTAGLLVTILVMNWFQAAQVLLHAKHLSRWLTIS